MENSFKKLIDNVVEHFKSTSQKDPFILDVVMNERTWSLTCTFLIAPHCRDWDRVRC